MRHLPDEVLMDVLRLCPAQDFAKIRLVDRRLSRLAVDPSVQRTVFAPMLLEPLEGVYKLRGQATPLSEAACGDIIHRANALLCARTPIKGAPRSWMHLVQQAHLVQRATQAQHRAQDVREVFVPGIWTGVVVIFAIAMGAGAVMCDQGTHNHCPELVSLGAACALFALLFVCLSPVLWLVYNFFGLVAEEAASFFDARLHSLLAGPCHHIDGLLQPLT